MLARLVLCALVMPSLAFPFFSFASDSNTADSVDPLSSGCSLNGPASCHNSSTQPNTCCFEASGGLIAQVQFWDTNPPVGPTDSWTIHGLWPDHCDGTWSEYCDPSRQYTDLSGLLADQGASDTLEYMQTYWVPMDGTLEHFWEHEWNKHGTCFSTLKTKCLPSGSPRGAEAVAYFKTAVALFKTLPTYEWLSDAGITPDRRATHALDEITSALRQSAGVTPALNCKGQTINEIVWYFNLRGSSIDGVWVPIDAPKAGTCKQRGLKYLPKSSSNAGDDINFEEFPLAYKPFVQDVY